MLANLKLYLYAGIAAIILVILGYFIFKPKPVVKSVSPTSPVATIAPDNKPIVINKPSVPEKQQVAKGSVTQAPQVITIRNNTQPIHLIAPVAKLESSDSTVIVDNEATNPQPVETTVPPGGATITLPQQKWDIKIDREYSPFRVNVYALPEPSVGLGYDLLTANLDKPLGYNLNLGNMSIGPSLSKGLLSNNTYAGVEVTKTLGNINANLGYEFQLGTGEGKVMAGISFNLK